MKLIIDIPEEEYELVRHGNKSYRTELELMYAVANGTPLPKHHGRLIDADALLQEHRDIDAYPFPSTTIQNAPTIIEADKENKE